MESNREPVCVWGGEGKCVYGMCMIKKSLIRVPRPLQWMVLGYLTRETEPLLYTKMNSEGIKDLNYTIPNELKT